MAVLCATYAVAGYENDDRGARKTADALSFAGIVLPEGARVLAVHSDRGIDTRYTLAIAVDPAKVTELLLRSRFQNPLAHDPSFALKVADGYRLAEGALSTYDELPPDHDRPYTVFRRVAVDGSVPEHTLVHISAFNT